MFDGVCNLCSGLVSWIIKWDRKGRIHFATLQSDTGQVLLEHFNISTPDLDSLVYIEGNNYYIKSTGVLKILHEMGGIWRFFDILFILPRSARDWLYDRVAARRYSYFGKRQSCMVPTDDIKARFL